MPAVERRHAATFSSPFSVARTVEEVLSIDRCPYELLNGMCSLTCKQIQSLLHFVTISNANEEPSVRNCFNNLEYTLLDFRRQNCLNKQY